MADWLLKGEPRPVQEEALRRSYEGYRLKNFKDDDNVVPHRITDNEGYGRTGPAKKWCHFLEQRLGKTPICLNEIELFRRDHNIRWAVGLSPNSFKDEWVEEAERFGASMPAYAFRSEDRAAAQRFVDRNRGGGMLVLNYQSLIYPDTLAFLANLIERDTYFFGDETVNIKNHDATTTKNAITLAKEAGVRRSMTGKPVVQGPHDMWSQLRFAGEISGFNYFAWKNTFCKTGGFKGKQVKGAKNEERFQDLLASCAFSARRVDWMTTPGKEYVIRQLQMLPEQLVHYKRMEAEFMTWIEQTGSNPITYDEEGDLITILADQVVTKLLKLQQISSGFIIDEFSKAHDIMPAAKNPLVVEIRDMMRNEITNKVIVFAHYTHTIDMLMEGLAEFDPAIIAGESTMRRYGRDVQTEKARFNLSPSCRVIVGQEKAIKYGHTLMGSVDDPCLIEIWAENSYSLDDRAQGEERPQGEGQKGLLSIYDLAPSPIAFHALRALQAKEDISASIMGYARETGILPHAPAP